MNTPLIPAPSPDGPATDTTAAAVEVITNPLMHELGALLAIAAVSFLVGLLFRRVVLALKIVILFVLVIVILAWAGSVSVQIPHRGIETGASALAATASYLAQAMALSPMRIGIALMAFVLGVYAQLRHNRRA